MDAGAVTAAQAADKYRVQLDLSGRALANLDKLKEMTNGSTRAQTIKDALCWMYWCAERVARGETIILEREGKKYVKISAKGGSASGGKTGEIIEREVTTGAFSSSGNVEILSGLDEGETVVLNIP